MKFGNLITSAAPMVNQRYQDNASKCIFEVITTTAYDTFAQEQDDIVNFKDSELGTYLKVILETINVSINSQLVRGKNIIANLNLHEIALGGIAYGFPVTTSEVSGVLRVNVCLPLAPDLGYLPFNGLNTLNFDITSSTHSCQLYVFNDTVQKSNLVSQIHKNTILANQFTPVKVQNQLAIIIPDLRDIDLNYTNGHTNSLVAEELDILNNMDGKVGAVGKNVCLSSYANAAIFKTNEPFIADGESHNLKDLRFHAEASQLSYYSVVFEKLNQN